MHGSSCYGALQSALYLRWGSFYGALDTGMYTLNHARVLSTVSGPTPDLKAFASSGAGYVPSTIYWHVSAYTL